MGIKPKQVYTLQATIQKSNITLMWPVCNLYENKSSWTLWIWYHLPRPGHLKFDLFHSVCAVYSFRSHPHFSLCQTPGSTVCVAHRGVYWVPLCSFLTGPWLLISYSWHQCSHEHTCKCEHWNCVVVLSYEGVILMIFKILVWIFSTHTHNSHSFYGSILPLCKNIFVYIS